MKDPAGCTGFGSGRIMDPKSAHVAVQALWLQYKGLAIEASRSWHRVDNAGYKPSDEPPVEDLPLPGVLLVAS